MGVQVNDVVCLKVTFEAHYACWGTIGDQTGFVHCYEYSWERPIPDSDTPKVGDTLMAKVFKVFDQPQDQLPLDVTFDGSIKVDFAASPKLLKPKPAGADTY